MHFGLYHKPDGALAALGLALHAAGHRATWRRPNVYAGEIESFDAVVVLGLRGTAGEVQRCYAAKGVPVVVVDLAHLRRERGFRRYTLGSLHWLPPFACPPDRFGDLEIELLPRRGGRAILICGQVPDDAAHGMTAGQLRTWGAGVIDELRKFTDRPVVWRPHPGAPGLSLPMADRVEEPEEELFAGDYHAVVTYNSTTGLEALAAGLPVFCEPMAFYAEAACSDLSRIEEAPFPSDGERQALFARVGYSQWADEEMRRGEAVDFLVACIEGRDPVAVYVPEVASPPAVNLVSLVGARAASALEALGGLDRVLAMPEAELRGVRYVGPKTLEALRPLRAA